MSITYYSIAKNIFAASSAEIGALKSFRRARTANLDHADHADTARDQTSQQAYIFNCEWMIKLTWSEKRVVQL